MVSRSSDALKVPPHDTEAEKSVLGALLIDAGTINQVFEFLRDEHFYNKEHQYIYSAMLTLFEKQEPIDLVTLRNGLKKSGNLKKVGGEEYLSELINTVPTAAYAEHYAHIVKDHYTKRRLIELSTKLVEMSFDEKGDAKTLLDDAESQIFALSQEHLHQDFAQLKDVLADSFERLDEFIKSGTQLRGRSEEHTTE